MADKNAKKNDKPAAAEGGEQEAKPSNMKKIIIFAVAGLLLVAISVGATLFLTGAFSKEKEHAAEEEAKPEEPVHERAEYLPLQPAFVINYAVKGRQRYLQVGVTLLYREPDVAEALKTHMPVIRNRLVMLFSGESFEALQTAEGKDALRQKTLDALHEILQKEIGKDGVEQVLFSDFVMQ